ncbi:MAG: hypothetical protein U1E33_00775 [Rhodospirillales bacterium]
MSDRTAAIARFLDDGWPTAEVVRWPPMRRSAATCGCGAAVPRLC